MHSVKHTIGFTFGENAIPRLRYTHAFAVYNQGVIRTAKHLVIGIRFFAQRSFGRQHEAQRVKRNYVKSRYVECAQCFVGYRFDGTN